MMLLAIGGLLVFSAIYSLVVMFGYAEKDVDARSVRQFLRPTNYFWSGMLSVLMPWLFFAGFAGFEVEIFGLSRGGGG